MVRAVAASPFSSAVTAGASSGGVWPCCTGPAPGPGSIGRATARAAAIMTRRAPRARLASTNEADRVPRRVMASRVARPGRRGQHDRNVQVLSEPCGGDTVLERRGIWRHNPYEIESLPLVGRQRGCSLWDSEHARLD